MARHRLMIPIEVANVGTGSTIDISASGVAFFIDASLEAGAEIHFELRVDDVVLKCSGRVIRTEVRGGRPITAASLDELMMTVGTEH